MKKRLLEIYEGIDRRARTTHEQHPSWPCQRGCDHCCRNLAEEMRMTRAEWELLREGIARLGADVHARLREPFARVCPLLDREKGECLVYAHRPIACRTYGYYVERSEILGCSKIVAAANDDVVWGNAQALATSSDEELPLSEWLSLDPPASPPSPSPSSSM